MKEIIKIAKSINEITLKAISIYGKQVENIISTNNKDEKYICQTLDGMLDFCFDEDMLKQYKKLCRYYYKINPQVTAEYIYLYREQWDSEKNNLENKK